MISIPSTLENPDHRKTGGWARPESWVPTTGTCQLCGAPALIEHFLSVEEDVVKRLVRCKGVGRVPKGCRWETKLHCCLPYTFIVESEDSPMPILTEEQIESIKARAAEKGLTIKELANKADVGVSTLKKGMTGKYDTSDNTLAKVEAALDDLERPADSPETPVECPFHLGQIVVDVTGLMGVVVGVDPGGSVGVFRITVSSSSFEPKEVRKYLWPGNDLHIYVPPPEPPQGQWNEPGGTVCGRCGAKDGPGVGCVCFICEPNHPNCCKSCGGRGIIHTSPPDRVGEEPCRECGGTGVVRAPRPPQTLSELLGQNPTVEELLKRIEGRVAGLEAIVKAAPDRTVTIGPAEVMVDGGPVPKTAMEEYLFRQLEKCEANFALIGRQIAMFDRGLSGLNSRAETLESEVEGIKGCISFLNLKTDFLDRIVKQLEGRWPDGPESLAHLNYTEHLILDALEEAAEILEGRKGKIVPSALLKDRASVLLCRVREKLEAKL